MNHKQSLTVLLELLWWAATAILVFAILHPILQALPVWPFEWWNILFIVVLVTFTRYIFLLQHTFLAKRQLLKLILILLLLPTTFLLVSGLHDFMNYVEEKTWDPLTGHLPANEKRSIEDYMWGVMIFFGTGSVIAAPVLAARLFLSIWRTRNRGTV